ncbi:MAG: hypothetical protein H6649_09980 [Caldilineae bacterium]|nr:hypothetical protein [Caldilineae bacterium]
MTPTIFTGLFEDSFNLKVWVQDGKRLPMPLSRRRGWLSSGWMRATLTALLVRSRLGYRVYSASSYDSTILRFRLFVPLCWRSDETVGSMSVQHHRPDMFDERSTHDEPSSATTQPAPSSTPGSFKPFN